MVRQQKKLKNLHTSVPANPLLAEPMYLKGYIERLGTGTADIIRIAHKNELKKPEFIQDDSFKTIIYKLNIAEWKLLGKLRENLLGTLKKKL